MKETVNIC